FVISHYAGAWTYNVRGFVSVDADLLDTALMALLRGSSVPFVSKLFAGPSLAAEPHTRDPNTGVQAQMTSRPLRMPTLGGEAEFHRLDPAKAYPSMAQLDGTLSAMLHGTKEGRARMWTVTCIRPNDSGSANSFDKRRVRAQLHALLVPAMVQRVSGGDYIWIGELIYALYTFC
ncbi:hypothetical protein C8R44DRAFT_550080, partial [Mycena epipterygia]